jgi:hypothetical protein
MTDKPVTDLFGRLSPAEAMAAIAETRWLAFQKRQREVAEAFNETAAEADDA